MATIVELDGVGPTIGEDVFLAPTAVLIGDVRVGQRCNIWFGTVLRGDVSHIEIGAGCSIQDTAVIHCASDLPTVIGEQVVVGHGAMLEGCAIEDGALIGMGA
ncbi:MAG TPA: gamma carbonic anhydrase family protein, partial [Solirubrobacteraceae bacterium]|nr:gamma carbonic anhydrase family protein [Solirubrobacteraceae bacterium]